MLCNNVSFCLENNFENNTWKLGYIANGEGLATGNSE